VGGNFGLNLDGKPCGFLKSVSGGAVSAEVITEQIGVDHVTHKHIGSPKYEDFSLEFGFSMPEAVYQWIADSWTAKHVRKNGSIVAYDYKLEAKSEREFFNALITETVIPALDGSSKEAAYLTLQFAPEYTRSKKASGKGTAQPKINSKPFLPSNFKLEIDGLDTTKVNRIDSFAVKQTLAHDDVGDARDYVKEPGKLEFPNLRISLSQVSADPWFAWFDDFVIKGNNGDGKEKNGTITFLNPSRSAPLGTVKLFNLGIFRISEDAATASSETIHRVIAELYCERMELHIGSKTAA
jgi:phage tail-like protein